MATKNKFDLDLDKDEEVKLVVPRGKIGLVLIWSSEILGFILLTIGLIWLEGGGSHAFVPEYSDSRKYIYFMIFALYIALLFSGLIGTVVYRGNHLVVTNKRIIQRVTTALFATQLKIVDLESVEDVSAKKFGPLAQMLNFGTLQMSTDSDETTYIFTFVDNPTAQVKKITRIIREFKESHPARKVA